MDFQALTTGEKKGGREETSKGILHAANLTA